jgi:hypothetical protein
VEGAFDPYFLVFSGSFHRGWKAFINKFPISNFQFPKEIVGSYFDGKIKEKEAKSELFDRHPFQTWRQKPLADDQHIVMNGYANSWYITPADANEQSNYQIIVEYQGQRLFYIGLAVTLATIIGSLGLGLLKYVKKS